MLGMPSLIWKQGQELTSGSLNQLSESLELGNDITVARESGLVVRDFGSGKRLYRNHANPIWGLLSGSTSPYTFTEQLDDGTGTWSSGTRTGTAYEVNSTASLNGKYVRLFPDPFGKWRFQYRDHSGSPPPPLCGACSGSLPTTFSYSFTYTPVDISDHYIPGTGILLPPYCTLLTPVTLTGTITLDIELGSCISGSVSLPLALNTVLSFSPGCYSAPMTLSVTCCTTSSRLSAEIADTSPPLHGVGIVLQDTDFVSYSCSPYTSTWVSTANDETCTLVISE